MKNTIVRILLLVIISGVITSCYDDLSKEADFRYKDVILKRNNEENNTVFFTEDFFYEPKIAFVEGKDTTLLDESDFSKFDYEWKLGIVAGGNSEKSVVISNERNLEYTVSKIFPNETPYWLILKVKNKETYIENLFRVELKVLNKFGNGLLIADTKDDENSDINLIMSREFNGDLSEESDLRVLKEIYSSINGSKLPGVISDLTYITPYRKAGRITGLAKGEHLYRIDPISYEVTAKDNEFFFYDQAVYNPQKIISERGTQHLINNGMIQSYRPNESTKYGFVGESEYNISENLCVALYVGYPDYYIIPKIIGYDKSSKSLVPIKDGKVTGKFKLKTEDYKGTYDPNAPIEGLDIVYGDSGPRGTRRILMKSDDNNTYKLYELGIDVQSWTAIGTEIYDLSACTGIKQSSHYALSEGYDEMYYNDGNILRVALIDVNITSMVVYTLPANEEITQIVMHKGRGNTTWGESVDSETGEIVSTMHPAKNNLLIVASYNPATKEGFIRSMPIEFGGVGGVAAEKYIKKYDGFGKITAMTLQQ